MKKLIAISVVFALVLGAAFAQPSLGGNFKVGTVLLNGESKNEVDETKVFAGGVNFDSLHLDAGFGDADAGGKIRFHPGYADGDYGDFPGYKPVFAFAWWRPIPQVRVQLGKNPDGDWGHDQIAGWGYDAEAKAVGVAISQYADDHPPNAKVAAQSGAWGPGFSDLGLTLSVYPIDGLQVNFGIPYKASARRASEVYSNIFFNVSYALEDIGTIRFSTQFKPGNHDRYVMNEKEASGEVEREWHWRGNSEDHQPSTLWLAFHLTAIEGLGAELGVGYTLPYTTQDLKFVADENGILINVGGDGYKTLPQNTKVNAPVSVGLGAQFSSGDFGVKARAGFKFAGSKSVDADKVESYTKERETRRLAGQQYTHIPLENKLLLESDTYYVKETTKVLDSYYKAPTDGSLYTWPIVDKTEWTAKSGTTTKIADPFQWGFHVAPSYKIGSATVFLNLGIGMKHYAKQEVTLQKYELYTTKLPVDMGGGVTYDTEGRETSKYIPVYEKKNDLGNGEYTYDTNSKPVMETITFEGRPGLYLSETNITYPLTQSELNALMDKAETIKFDVDWFVNPYVQIPAGGGQFYVGFKLYTDGTKIPVKYSYNKTNADKGVAAGGVSATGIPANIESTKSKIKWAIPIGWNFYF